MRQTTFFGKAAEKARRLKARLLMVVMFAVCLLPFSLASAKSFRDFVDYVSNNTFMHFSRNTVRSAFIRVALAVQKVLSHLSSCAPAAQVSVSLSAVSVLPPVPVRHHLPAPSFHRPSFAHARPASDTHPD